MWDRDEHKDDAQRSLRHPTERDYREDRTDDALRMSCRLKDQAGVSHGISGLHGL